MILSTTSFTILNFYLHDRYLIFKQISTTVDAVISNTEVTKTVMLNLIIVHIVLPLPFFCTIKSCV